MILKPLLRSAVVVSISLFLGACGGRSTVTTTSENREEVMPPTSASVSPGSRHDLPEGFPLAAGWPDESHVEPGADYGLRTPTRDGVGIRLEACGATAPDPSHTDRLVAGWTNVEDYRARQVTTYVDSQAARDALAAVIDLYRACPTDPGTGDGYTTRIDLSRTDTGEESWAVIRTSRFHDLPAVGLEVLLVIRVGRAVLVDTAANEGGGGSAPESDTTRQFADQTVAATEVLDALCAYASGGCLP